MLPIRRRESESNDYLVEMMDEDRRIGRESAAALKSTLEGDGKLYSFEEVMVEARAAAAALGFTDSIANGGPDGPMPAELSLLVTKVFDAWGLTQSQRGRLIGLSPVEGSLVLSGQEAITRSLHIVTIYEILHCSNTKRPDLADSWPTTPLSEFDGNPSRNYDGIT